MAIDLITPTLEERISQIQLTAYAHVGLGPADIAHRFAAIQAQTRSYRREYPEFLSHLEADALGQTTDDEPHLPSNAGRLPYQDPLIHAWLLGVWRYHTKRVYDADAPVVDSLLLASASSGRFNALANSDEAGRHAILIEDGLLHFARQFADLVSPLLYTFEDERLHYVTMGNDLAQMLAEKADTIDQLLDITLQYVTSGYVQTPSYSADDPIHPASRAMFHGLISFVIEHELHHLLARPSGKHVAANIDESFNALWRKFEADVLPHVSSPVDKPEVRQMFEDHQEEILADFRAINLVFEQARVDQSVWPTMDGVMMFFHIAELHRWTTNRCAIGKRRLQSTQRDTNEREYRTLS